jgi:hypothetical protein
MEERRLPGETEAVWNLVRDGEVWTYRVWASPYLPEEIRLRVLPHSSTPAILSKTRLRMRLWTKRIRFTRAARPQKDRASIR